MVEFHGSWPFFASSESVILGEPVKKAKSQSAVAPVRVPLCKPYISEEEELAAAEVLRSGWLMQGPRTDEFEGLVADFVGVKYAVAVNSGTSALTLALMAAGLSAGEIGRAHV